MPHDALDGLATRRLNKADDLHLALALRAFRRVQLVVPLDEHGPGLAGSSGGWRSQDSWNNPRNFRRTEVLIYYSNKSQHNAQMHQTQRGGAGSNDKCSKTNVQCAIIIEHWELNIWCSPRLTPRTKPRTPKGGIKQRKRVGFCRVL